MTDPGFLISYGGVIWLLLVATGAALGAAIVWKVGVAWAGRRARRARAQLGEAASGPFERIVGQAVTLTGTLEARGQPCARYEDGAEAAIATATRGHDPARSPERGARSSGRSGERKGDTTAKRERAQIVFPEVSTRAETLVVRMAAGPVFLDGPVRVVAGSLETSRGGRLRRLGSAVLRRVGESDLAVEWELQHRRGAVRFRSLRSGDRVRVAGVLARREASCEGAQSYRESAAGFCLSPRPAAAGGSDTRDARSADRSAKALQDAGCVRAAFEGAPVAERAWWRWAAGAMAGALVSLGALGGAGISLLERAVAKASDAEHSKSAARSDLGEEEAALAAMTPFVQEEAIAHVLWAKGVKEKRAQPPCGGCGVSPWQSAEDEMVAHLDAGDFDGASRALPDDYREPLHHAKVHVLAGEFSRAASALRRHGQPRPAGMWPCLVDALVARGGFKSAPAARARLAGAGRSHAAEDRFCVLLWVDLFGVKEGLSRLGSLSPGAAPSVWRRVQSLLELEAALSPSSPPGDDFEMPRPMDLIWRHPWSLAHRALGVHVERALSGSLRARPPDGPRWEAYECANAVYVLSALGDHAGARAAWDRTRLHGRYLDEQELVALRVAVEIRAGDMDLARAYARQLRADHRMSMLVRVLDGQAIGPRPAEDYDVECVHRLIDRGDDATEIARDLLRRDSPSDGEMLFLIAPRVTHAAGALLSWVRLGNPERDRHDQKGPPAPPAPMDRLMRLEERRSMAASLGDQELAKVLSERLTRGRERLLQREIAVLLALL